MEVTGITLLCDSMENSRWGWYNFFVARNVLLHTCCGPCTIYTLKSLREEGLEVTGFFFNPNIHPYTEFGKRLATLKDYAAHVNLPLVVDREYDLPGFLSGALENKKDRCLFCYRVRLDRAFQQAREHGADGVTTTLLYSRFQKHDAIKAVGEDLSHQYGIPFLYRDFRKGWGEGVAESKRLNMYRQQYCGCIFSEWERYRGK